jgi:hypothetical protein
MKNFPTLVTLLCASHIAAGPVPLQKNSIHNSRLASRTEHAVEPPPAPPAHVSPPPVHAPSPAPEHVVAPPPHPG